MDLTKIVTEIIQGIFSLLRQSGSNEAAAGARTQLESHLTEVERWSRQVQFWGLATGENTRDNTVPLDFDTVPRKFRGSGVVSPKVDELTLLSDRNNTLLIGDPGSGKTTTIKRLVRRILEDEAASPRDRWQYPVVVRLRSAGAGLSIFQLIADALGIHCNEPPAPEGGLPAGGEAATGPHPGRASELFVGRERLDRFIPKLLDRTGAILFIDGLDELAIDDRPLLERSIATLALRLLESKVLLSCRSGDYTSHFDSFNVVEICPLEPHQIEWVAEKWLPDRREFMAQIEAVPFQDLVNRPLFLCHLIVYFRSTGSLPDRPSDVYRKILRLVLEDWDRRRGVRRLARSGRGRRPKATYADFDPDKKLEFLAALSYSLTYRIKTKRFDRGDLEEAYGEICEDFDLDIGQASQVAQNIETHTGVLVESGDDNFEFSHLSLQEFLCAHYLVREPSAESLIDYLREYPAPVAVAAVLASNSSKWISALILNRRIRSEINERSMAGFLSRLYQERPRYSISPYLGFAALSLTFLYWGALGDSIQDWLRDRRVARSAALALEHYRIEAGRSTESKFWIRLTGGFFNERRLLLPREGFLPRTLLADLEGRVLTRTAEPETAGEAGSFRAIGRG